MRDDYSRRYGKDADLPARRYSYHLRLKRVLEALNGSKSVLDIGSASGDYAVALAQKGFTVTCLDTNREDLLLARGKDPRVMTVHGTATTLPFAESSFDVVLILNALRYFEKRQAAVEECRRVLRREGELLIIEHNRHCPDTLLVRKDVRKYFSERSLVQLLTASGFRIKSKEMEYVPPPFFPPKVLELSVGVSSWLVSTGVGRVYPELFVRATRGE